MNPLPASMLAAMCAEPPRGVRHIFLGDPWGSTADKTVVEPGNISSPGLWTCGITVWVDGGVGPVSATSAAIETWELDPPTVRSRWRSGQATVMHELVHCAAGGAPGVDRHRIHVDGAGSFHLVVRGAGPAGGKIRVLNWLDQTLSVDGIRLRCQPEPLAVQLLAGPMAVLTLSAGIVVEVEVAHRSATLGAIPREADTSPHAEVWIEGTPLSMTWRRCAHHLLAAAERGLPRIGVANYPGLWLRDAVLVVHAWDLLGRHDLARTACEAIASMDFAGGFGAESDAPGEGAWLLERHAALTRDRTWLASQRPHVERRARLIAAMRRTAHPLHAVASDRMPRYIHHPEIDLLCRAAANGCISSRMDWHAPDFFCNAWAVAGLRAAASAAQASGDATAADAWMHEAADLEEAMREHLLPRFGNERDAACTPWPTGTLATATEAAVRKDFMTRRRKDAQRIAEPLWTYFEAAQLHNALRCGLREEAWDSLLGMIADGEAVAAFGEGPPGGAEYLPWGPAMPVGWLDPVHAGHGNMPHNWTCAELVAAMRSVLVIETPDGLRLGAGLPRALLKPGLRCGVRNLPTALGTISWELTLDTQGRPTLRGCDGVPYHLDLP